MSSAAFSKVTLKRAAESRVFGGHLWIFSNELHEGFQSFQPGEIVEVVDTKGRSYGVGSINPHSLIAVRILSRECKAIGRSFLHAMLERALESRSRLIDDCNVCRIVFSESDFLPGLIVDRFESVTVYQALTYGMERMRPAVEEWLDSRFAGSTIIAANDSSMRSLEGLVRERVQVTGDPIEMSWFRQDGLRLLVDPLKGQKTGFFLDQRVNRKLMQSYVRRGDTFLDLFCYSGAFGVYALQAGARHVTFVDGSRRALELAGEVSDANGFLSRYSLIEADVFEWIKEQGEQFDLVSLDPPALAKNRSKAMTALRAYRDLNARAMKRVKPGGLLFTSSCSGLISRVNWRNALEDAAFKSHRRVRFVAFGTQSPDHPVLAAMPETEYLKFAVLQVF